MPEPPRIRAERTKSRMDIANQRARITRAMNEAYLRNGMSAESYERRFRAVMNTAQRYITNMRDYSVNNGNLLGWLSNSYPRSVYARRG